MIPQLEMRRGVFFGIGNPLIDFSKEVSSEFLSRYRVEEHQAIIATEEHDRLFSKLEDEGRSTSGGSSQNIMRTISWFLNTKEPVATFMGAVGDDFEKSRLIDFAQTARLSVCFETRVGSNTGKCAVLINNRDRKRSMVTDMGASNEFSVDFLMKEGNWKTLENADIICSEGFFLMSCREAFMRVCEHAHKKQKIFVMTLSAQYICADPYGVRLLSALAYADIIFGYEDEAKTLARQQLNVETTDLETALKALRDAPKWNPNRSRTIIVSKIPIRTTVATNEGIKTYQWNKPDTITDTHGCGAALAGGFLASMAQGKTLDQCINAGLYCALEILQRLGSLFPPKQNYKDILYYATGEAD